VTGVYAAAYDSAEGWDKLKEEINTASQARAAAPRDDRQAGPGRPRPRRQGGGHRLCRPGLRRGHGPAVPDPEECARQAIENDVHAVGVSTLAAGHKTLVPAIIAELKKQGADDIIVFVGGVIPAQDYDFLYNAGVKGVYGPGTPIPASAKDVLEQIKKANGL
jgi:methylmalonyl-CoA mutase